MKKNKSGLLVLSALAATLAGPAAHAAYHEFTASIYAVGTSDETLWGKFRYVLLNGVTTAGACYVDPNTNKVIIKLPDAEAYAAALAAHMAGRQVQISLDDTFVDTGGNCKMRWIRVLD
ncbi:hypothetical protein GCM10011487_64360 [Steroidobacter agaridevorans]|uniref:Uncharacterized protein n=1 Tax=Steroidobacter agaridevorans TaxID=2695856 RepID=A0A829YPM8_9GAMM|nr:hypothetical protein [Steroidobacter agaridevorans]GFE84436.1 hypothetical protein GCM10011487_64360 [Steroidobacter agaridevorans]GFE90834.1 hypothetical protein GCM10011488_57880 [Steroidobacter agaridevorans]